MMPPGAEATPAPIHDIVDAVAIFPYPPWMVALGILLLALLLGFLVWFFFFRPKKQVLPTPRERAVAGLADLRQQTLQPYEFGIAISDILRRFIDEAFGIRAVTATSLEFLQSIQNNPRFRDEQKEALRGFLDSVDLIKFARVDAEGEDLERLFQTATEVIEQSSQEVPTS